MKKKLSVLLFLVIVAGALLVSCQIGSDIGQSGTSLGTVDMDGDGTADGTVIDVDGDGEPDGVDTDGDGVIDEEWSEDYSVETDGDGDGDSVETEPFSCNAGDDFSVTSLGKTVILTATVSNAASDLVSYSWTASDSNPSTVTISSSNTASASFDVSMDLDEGAYTFTITADDGNSTVTDSVVITVDYVEKIIASDGEADDEYGFSVSLSADGKTALVGARKDDSKGSAYVYSLNGGLWTQTAKLTASDGVENDLFGCSVSISSDGTTALIGAFGCDYTNGGEGAAYIFTYNAGSWVQSEKFTASDLGQYAYFGCSVSLSYDGTTALIGAPTDNSAYIFIDSDSGWTQGAKLTNSDSSSGGYLGCSVSLSSDGAIALVGDMIYNYGAAFIFNKESSWDDKTEDAVLTASDGAENDYFGNSVSLSSDGTTALIGSANNGGAAYVYSKGSSWSNSTEDSKLTASDNDLTDDDYSVPFVSISADGSIALIGADESSINGTSTGAVYVYSKGSSWSDSTEDAKLYAYDGTDANAFGTSVSLSADGSTAFISAENGDGQNDDSGAAYSFFLDY
ncbi:MAG: hypothetical protein PQJ46_14850 [Spirochaetales bacterium]|nr:hypothetical protein [Spirochaetales bacterium]